MSTFSGFPRETLTFLRGLSRNNEKHWFDAHRSEYEAYFLEPAKAFVEAAGDGLERFAPGVHAEPRVNGSIFRINRDIRFSKDKTPYKDHLDMWFWEGERKGAVSGFYMRVGTRELSLGVGAHCFDKNRLKTYRDAVCDARERRLAGEGDPCRRACRLRGAGHALQADTNRLGGTGGTRAAPAPQRAVERLRREASRRAALGGSSCVTAWSAGRSWRRCTAG